MLTKKQSRVRHPPKRVLEVISDALREIEAHFEILGFSWDETESASVEAPAEEAETDQDVEETDEEYDAEYVEEDESGGGVYQREEIEVAIDLFISGLIAEGVIRKPKDDRAPSLVSIFERIFGEAHEIVESVKAFDEHIEGYFGAIGYDDMNSAYGDVVTIRDIINKDLASHAAK